MIFENFNLELGVRERIFGVFLAKPYFTKYKCVRILTSIYAVMNETKFAFKKV